MNRQMDMIRLLVLPAICVLGSLVSGLRAQTHSYLGPERDRSSDNVFEKAAEQANRRCVKLIGRGIGKEHGYATGLIVSPDGLVITAQGVYLADDRLTAITSDGRRYTAKVIDRSTSLQAAVLQLTDGHDKPKTPDFFELPRGPVVRQGDWVLAVGNWFKVADGPEPMSVSLGVVSMRGELDVRHRAVDVAFEGEKIIVDCITSNPGAGGGALVTVDGRLAGMIGKLFHSKATNTRLNYAIPAERLAELIAGKPPKVDTPPTIPVARQGKAYTGLKIFTLAGRDNPAYVSRVVRQSPADKAGFKKDDMIVVMDNQVVPNVKTYKKLSKQLVIGKRIIVVVRRNKDQLVPLELTPTVEPE